MGKRNRELEAEANRILRDAGDADLATHPDLIPTTDCLAHSRFGYSDDHHTDEHPE